MARRFAAAVSALAAVTTQRAATLAQPDQVFYDDVGSFEDHEMSPGNQRLIVPPRPPPTNLVPRLRKHWPVGEAFFTDDDTFIDDSDDYDEPPPGQSDRRSNQREGPTLRATGWCNGDMERQGESRAAKPAETVG